jgi:hypothetical protein
LLLFSLIVEPQAVSSEAALLSVPAPNNFDPNDPGYQLAVALGKKGAYTLNSVCFVPGFYAASATAAVGGLAVANSGEIVAAASENYPTLLQQAAQWLDKMVGRTPSGPSVVAVATAAASQVSQFCSSH